MGDALAVGTVLGGRYRVDAVLGEGAMGVVYAGRHLALGREVAIKTLRPELATDDQLVARLEQEARAASAIGHPNIVQVFDLGVLDSGGRYIVMERLVGRTLAAVLEGEGPLSPARAVDLVAQLLDALAAAHERGIVHRDLKPENLFVRPLDGGREMLQVLDFGISKIVERGAREALTGGGRVDRTRAGTLLGTPAYMAPEQAAGDADVGPAADIWATGVVLYEAVCGARPFVGDDHLEVIAKVLQGAPRAPSEVRPELPARLEAVIVRALARRPADRFAGAADMRAALRAAVGASEEAAREASMPTPTADDARLAAALEGAGERGVIALDGAEEAGRPAPAAGTFAPPEDDAPLELEAGGGVYQEGVERYTQRVAPRRPEPEPASPEVASASGGRIGPLVVALLLAAAGAAVWLLR